MPATRPPVACATLPSRLTTVSINPHAQSIGADTADAWRRAISLDACADGPYYVVKFQNNPQHRRILVNELLGTRLASHLGLPTAPVAIIEVSEELIRLTSDLVMEPPRHRFDYHAGPQFGSRYPGDPRRLTLHDFLPDQQLPQVEN